jgi:hypothetical protein
MNTIENNVMICNDLGCAYKLSDDGALLWTPLMSDGTYDDDEFGDVEPELVGEERVTFENREMTLYTVYDIVRGRLADYNAK